MAKYDIISFGSAIVDFFIKVNNDQIKQVDQKNLVCFPGGEKTEIKDSFVFTGGGGTNTATSFARQGLKVGLVARLGSDPLGKVIINDLKKESVSCDFLTAKDESTDFSIIMSSPDGDRTILVCRGKNRLVSENVPWENLDSGWFYISSLEGNLNLAEEIITFASKKGISVAWNPGKRELINKEKVITLAKSIEVFNINRSEAEELFGLSLDSDGFWQKMAELNIKKLVVTDGRTGAYLLSEGEKLFLPSPKIQPVDETGAGDAFGSGFVAGLIKGSSPTDSFNLAMTNGASVVKFLGAKKGLLRNS